MLDWRKLTIFGRKKNSPLRFGIFGYILTFYLCTGENILTKRQQESREKTKLNNDERNNWYSSTNFIRMAKSIRIR
jgi:hypothetical protein